MCLHLETQNRCRADEGIGVPFELPDRAGHSTLRYAIALAHLLLLLMQANDWYRETRRLSGVCR
jgi:hypothetical protein